MADNSSMNQTDDINDERNDEQQEQHEQQPLITSDEERGIRIRGYDGIDAAHRAHEDVRGQGVTGWIRAVVVDFKNFINKGSVLDLAVGIVIGEAFSSVVTSFVGDIFSPLLGLIISSKLSEAFVVIRKGPHYPYNTREEARKDGAVTWNYGNFSQLIINFVCISMCLFVVVRMSKAMQRRRISTKNTKECPLCYSEIDGRARKCAFCGGDLKED